MEVGDLVEVSFGGTSPAVPGLFVSYDKKTADFFDNPTRALVLWEGEVHSTPIEQIEVLCESR